MGRPGGLVVRSQGASRWFEIEVTRRALVTGANGFVGVPLCKLLVERGWRVVASQRRAAPHPEDCVTPEYLPL